jgi:hypothetical protein
MSALDSCSGAVTSVAWDSGKKIVFHAIAAFPPGSSPRLKAASFGIDYDSAKFVLAARGSCADFEISDGGWPAPGTGTAQTWPTATQTGLLTEAYWFVGYAYSEQDGEDSTSVALIPHPLQHGVLVDDAFPAEVDTIAAYGRLGFGTAKLPACPGSGDQGQAGLEDPTPDGEGTDGSDNDNFFGQFGVYPTRIHAEARHWTFLITGTPPRDLRSVALRIGNENIESFDHSSTGESTSLWDFRYPPVAPNTPVWLRVDARGRSLMRVDLKLGMEPIPPEDEVTPGRLGIKLAPRTMQWQVILDNKDPRYHIRSLAEVPCNDRFLSLLLPSLGITKIMRPAYDAPDGDSTSVLLPTGRVIAVLPFMRSMYSFYYPTNHSPQAMGEILKISPLVRDVEWSGRVVIRSGPCDTGMSDPIYPNQWELQAWPEGSDFGVEANWAWCNNRGAGRRIFLLDRPVPSAQGELQTS